MHACPVYPWPRAVLLISSGLPCLATYWATGAPARPPSSMESHLELLYTVVEVPNPLVPKPEADTMQQRRLDAKDREFADE